jgi:iron(III) transport system substrate-binding protein
MKFGRSFVAFALALVGGFAHAEPGEVVVVCSQQPAWCNLMQSVFSKTSGIEVRMLVRSAGEALAQITAERANPKIDLWFGGTGDPHLLAAQQDLTISYKSPVLPELHEWAQKQAVRSAYKTVGLYSGPLGWGYNSELLAKKKLAAPKTWADLLKPEYKGEIQLANPASSGTAYTLIATLVQLMGEDKAFAYLGQLHKNISSYTRSGAGPIKAAARGKHRLGLFSHPMWQQRPPQAFLWWQ